MNKVIQVVTLGADPEIKSYGNDNTLASFSGAVRKRFVKDGEPDADWFKYVAFGKTAEFIQKYFKKGSKALIEGEIHNNNYTDQNGNKVYGTQITINNVEFYGSKTDGNVGGGNSAPAQSNPAPAAPANNTPAQANTAPATSSYDAYDDF